MATVRQEDQLRKDVALQGAFPAGYQLWPSLHSQWGALGAAQEQLLHSTHTHPTTATCHSQSKEQNWHQQILLWGSHRGQEAIFHSSSSGTSGPTLSGLQVHELYPPVSAKAWVQPRQWAGRRATAGCGTGATDAIGAPGTAKGAPAPARTHSAAVCTVCTRQCLNTALALFRMEKTPLYTSSQ